MFSRFINAAGLAAIAQFVLLAPASADITVTPRLRYGSVMIAGQRNPGAQASSEFFEQSTEPNADFTIEPLTAGTSSEDHGEISGHLNRKIRLRAGQYELRFSNMTREFEVREGETTTIKLRKVKPAYMEGTEKVILIDSEYASSDDDYNAVGTWEKSGEERVPVYYCERPWFGGRGPVEGGCAEGSRKWVQGYRRAQFKRSWKSAVFYVLPGVYSMKWTMKDGSTHQENKITVK